MMVGDQTLPIENASGAEHCHEEGQYLRTTFLVVCSEERNLITARTPHLAGDYCFRHVCLLIIDKCDVSRSTDILETLRNTSAQSFI